ncbi:MarR family winged helix-turn-helix transcriptional regulator [Bifidobacterium porcinum]|uniref:MarR family winged helix-turn-helix transcriptional regulator n=1 Tax=Bifidobacterium porcinum TaxID=212365 RepID=UPI0039937847
MAFEDEAFERMHKIMSDGRSSMMEKMNRVHRGEPAVMRELNRHGELTPGQLVEATGNSPGRISAILSALEKKGMITRRTDPQNRRRVIVTITPEGRHMVELHKRERDKRMRWVFGQMGERNTEEFLDLLARFVTYLSLCTPGTPVPDDATIAKTFEKNGIPYEPAADRVNVELADVPQGTGRCTSHDDTSDDTGGDAGDAAGDNAADASCSGRADGQSEHVCE